MNLSTFTKPLGTAATVVVFTPVIASKYQLTIKSTDRFNAFLQWAIHGNRNQEQDWLPEINPNETWDPNNKPDGLWLGEFKRRLNYRRHRLWEKTEAWWNSLCNTYEQYSGPEPVDHSCQYDEWDEFSSRQTSLYICT